MIDNFLLLKNKTVLFAEDDEIIKTEITEILKMLFKDVLTADNGQDAFYLYEDYKPDLIISDIKMPIVDGLELAKKIRVNDYNIPIILITSFAEQELLLNAANLSIDGYIIKPFKLEALTSSIQKSMNRNDKKEGLIPLNKNIYYHTGTQELYQDGIIVNLGAKELELLKLLISKNNSTVTKNEISEYLWPLESISESSIKNLVLRIRKKLNSDIIVSVRGVGYRLDTPQM